MIRALALISGGLDSILAAILVKNQRIDVTGIVFHSLFFSPQISPIPQIPLITKDISISHLQIVKNPPHGYGKNANPCIDCHLLMFKEAKKILKKEGYDFIISGEILGQRPFSQNKNSLALIEKEADLKGLILRPLSAKLLPLTIPEQKNWIDREKLLDISGRSRKIQLKLAKKFKIKNYSTPGTSCILTDFAFSQRLFKLLKMFPQAKSNDIKLLRLGRHRWLKATRLNSPNGTRLNKQSGISRKFGGPILLIVGRNHEENIKLKKLAMTKDVLIEPKTFPGPTVLIRPYKGKINKKTLEKAKKLLISYSKCPSPTTFDVI